MSRLEIQVDIPCVQVQISDTGNAPLWQAEGEDITLTNWEFNNGHSQR